MKTLKNENKKAMSNDEGKEEIPQWVIEYNNQNHQSSAGKAIKILMGQLAKERELRKELVEALEFVVVESDNIYNRRPKLDNLIVQIEALIQKSKEHGT